MSSGGHNFVFKKKVPPGVIYLVIYSKTTFYFSVILKSIILQLFPHYRYISLRIPFHY